MLKVIDESDLTQVSYKTGVAHLAGDAQYPQLWKGLTFSLPTFLRASGAKSLIPMPRAALPSPPFWGAGATITDTRFGSAVNLSGGSTGYVTIGSPPGLMPKTGIAISAWVRTTVSGYQQIFTKDGLSGTRFWQFRFNAGLIEMICFTGASPGTATGTTLLNDGEWHHVFGTWDGLNIEVWADGILEASVAKLGPVNTGADRVTYIGKSDVGSDWWAGDIGQIAFWENGIDGNMAAPLLYRDPYALNRLGEEKATRVPPPPVHVLTDTPWIGLMDGKLYLTSGTFSSTLKQSEDISAVSASNRAIGWDGTNTPWIESAGMAHLQSGQFTSTIKVSTALGALDSATQGMSSTTDPHTPLIGDTNNKIWLTSGQFSTTVKDSVDVTAIDDSVSGISWDGTNSPWSGSTGDKLYLQSGQFTSTVKTSEYIGGIEIGVSDISWNGVDTLWVGFTDDKLYLQSGQFTSTLKTSEAVGGVDAWPIGIDSNDFNARVGFSPDATVTPAEQALVLALPVPTISIVSNPTITPSAITMTLAQPALVPTNITLPSEQALVLAVFAPTLDIFPTTTVLPAALALTLALPVPSYLTPDALVAPAEQSLALAVLAPTLAIINNPTVTPAPLAITAVLRTPNVSFDETHTMSSELVLTLAQPVPFVGIDETRVFPDPITMSLTLEDPQEVGEMIVVYASTLSMTMAQPSAAAPATQVDLTLPLMTLDAEAYGRWNTGEYPAFEITLPMVTLEASGFSGEVLSFNTSLPMLTLEIRAGINVDMSLPLMTLEASGTTTDVGSLTKSLPMMTLEASGTNEAFGTFSKSLPMFKLEISLLSGGIHNFASTLPLLELEAYCVVGGAPGDFASSLPMLTLSASGNDSQNGNLSKSLPLLTLEAFSTGYSNRFI